MWALVFAALHRCRRGCQVCKWVTGSVRIRQTSWGFSTVQPIPRTKLFKGGLTAAVQSGPGSTGLRAAAALDHTWSPFRLSGHFWLISKCYVMLWLCLRDREDTGCLLKAQLVMRITGSGRTLRIRSMAGTPIIQLWHRLFVAVSAALLLFLLTCCVSALPVHCSITIYCICARNRSPVFTAKNSIDRTVTWPICQLCCVSSVIITHLWDTKYNLKLIGRYCGGEKKWNYHILIITTITATVVCKVRQLLKVGQREAWDTSTTGLRVWNHP